MVNQTLGFLITKAIASTFVADCDFNAMTTKSRKSAPGARKPSKTLGNDRKPSKFRAENGSPGTPRRPCRPWCSAASSCSEIPSPRPAAAEE